MALALAGVMAASALTGCEKIEDTKAASENTTAAKAPDDAKAGEKSGEGETEKEAAKDTAAGEKTAKATPEEQWAVDAGLYEDETSDELYKKALDEEGGKVVIYSISSRMAKVKASFEEDYPGMTLEVYDINANDMSTKLSTEYNSGIRTADVIHSKEQTGDYMINFFNKGILHNYQPESIYKNVNQEYLKDMTPLYLKRTGGSTIPESIQKRPSPTGGM